jgi:putative restriction endonuclease
MARKDWTREQLIVAFNLYCRTSFGRIHNRNPEIIELAKAIGRTPSALSWKLANFSRFDTSVTDRNLTGATHGSKLDREIWEEFNSDWDKLAFESEKLRAKFLDLQLPDTHAEEFPLGRTKQTSVAVRVNQGFFRSVILAAYESRCCITGLAIPDLLCASHIVPWSTDVANRTNPRNGLCLNAIHDRAFDRGFISIDGDYRVVISPVVKRAKDDAANDLLNRYEGIRIKLPHTFRPNADFLAYHKSMIFRNE